MQRIKNWFFPAVIFLVCAFISFKNFTPDTFLTGWDNLHPEFNFRLNIERSLNAAWQEYQGVGLLGGMAHAADLPRQLFLWLVSVVIPVSFIRYFWTFLMLFLGPLGVYFVALHVLNNGSSLTRGPRSPNAAAVSSASVVFAHKLSAFTASVFYIFNLATVQYFFVPFETFIGFYGFLPWLVFGVIGYLNSGKLKDLLLYFVISLFATTAFYVQTLFLVYIIFLSVILLFSLFKKFKVNLKRSLFILFVTFFVNAFWLLPVSWFSLTSNDIPQKSQINMIASPETIYMNRGRANFTDIVNLRGYWFDYYDFGKEGQFDYLFSDWIGWIEKPYVTEIGVGLFLASVIGLLISGQFMWLILLGFSYLMLNQIDISIPVFAEAFRNSFTKWSVAFSFVISLGLGYFVSKFKKISILPAVVLIGLSVYSVYPILDGKLISERVKTKIPNSYFEVFDWFNKNTYKERVAFFPAFDKWGWNYHNWGYGGSGFIWYGIENPILDRAFDVWSPNNETFYKQITKAILDQNIIAFENTLKKYQVRYLLVDNSVVFPWGDKLLLKVETINDFTKNLAFENVFEKENLRVYDTGITTIPENYSFVDADTTYSPVDLIFEKFGDYVSKSTTNNQQSKILSYPFVNFDNRSEVEIGILNNELRIKNKTTNSEIKLEIKDKLEENFDINHGYENSKNCDLKEKGKVERYQLEKGRRYVASDGGVACDYFVFGDAKYDTAYVLHIKGVNKEGRSLKIYLYNWETKRVEVEELLPEDDFDEYYVIYPKPTTKSGYTLNVETRSFGKVASENLVDTLELLPFDYNLVTSRNKGEGEKPQKQHNNLKINKVNKIGTAIYKVDIQGYAMPAGRQGLLQLGQGYEKGWMAIKIGKNQLNDFKLLEHVKINGWSNGWIISQSQSEPVSTVVYILFWPQFLEWFGFLVLLLTGVVLVLKLRT